MISISFNRGFTLIELMIVVAIIGILAAIAIPQFSSYRISSFNSSAVADLRNLLTSEEAYYIDHQSYLNLNPIEGYLATIPSLPGARLGTLICATITNATATDYNAKTQHKNGNTTYSRSQSGNIMEINKDVANYDLGCQ